jgi:hypothetical protein
MQGATTGSSSSRQGSRCEDICRRARARAHGAHLRARRRRERSFVHRAHSARRVGRCGRRTEQGEKCAAPLTCRPARVTTPALPCSFLVFPPFLASPACRPMCFRICRILRQVIVVAALHLCAGLTSTSHAGPVAAVGQVNCVCVCVFVS